LSQLTAGASRVCIPLDDVCGDVDTLSVIASGRGDQMSTMEVHPHVTFDEFLLRERNADIKSELIGGLVYAMAGASQRHNDITVNLVVAIAPAARAAGCRARASDQLVRVDDINGKYPDFGVYCENETHDFYTTAPCLLAEVLSPSSHERDKVTKLAIYRSLPSLRAYLVIDPETSTVIAHLRDRRGSWASTTCGPGDVLGLPCPDMLLNISDVFL
jgi:Uma2 family endonuclease